jgi:hypothetical protein
MKKIILKNQLYYSVEQFRFSLLFCAQNDDVISCRSVDRYSYQMRSVLRWWSTVHVSITIQYSTIQYSTIQYNTIQYSTIQYNTIQYSTIQYSTIQYSTKERSILQYSKVRVLYRLPCSSF